MTLSELRDRLTALRQNAGDDMPVRIDGEDCGMTLAEMVDRIAELPYSVTNHTTAWTDDEQEIERVSIIADEGGAAALLQPVETQHPTEGDRMAFPTPEEIRQAAEERRARYHDADCDAAAQVLRILAHALREEPERREFRVRVSLREQAREMVEAALHDAGWHGSVVAEAEGGAAVLIRLSH